MPLTPWSSTKYVDVGSLHCVGRLLPDDGREDNDSDGDIQEPLPTCRLIKVSAYAAVFRDQDARDGSVKGSAKS